ncbi:hypothetical protein ACFSRY_10390 [Pontibacter locisalis]|uniref:Outer membrane protein beta-barrel domain-containing protein n=1 Tax=Pontibacter locisalis TaxID=1719035 RepID=A0ABW5ILI3_9BACT
MKHFLLSLFFLSLVASTTSAQNSKGVPGEGSTTPLGSSIGGSLSSLKIIAGITGGGINFKDDTGNAMNVEFGPSLGYMLGVARDHQFGQNLIIQPGISLVGFGSKVVDADYTYNIHYLSFHANAHLLTAFKIYAGGGLFLDYGLFGSQGYPSGESNDIFESGGFSRLNSGLNLEAGYPLVLQGKSGEVFASYRIGLNNVEGDDAPAGQTTKLRMFTIGLKYSL